MPMDIIMPKVGGYDVQTAVLLRWLKREGDRVDADEPIAEVESAKAVLALPAPRAGTLVRLLVAEQSEVPVGTVLAVLAPEGEDMPAAAGPASEPAVATSSELGMRLRASPLARKLAAQWSIDLSQVEGTGPGGRIIREDVERVHEQRSPMAPDARATPAAELSSPGAVAAATLQPLSKMRRAIAERMTRSATTVPHFTVVNEIDMQAAFELRSQLNARLEGSDITITDLVVRAAVLALQRFPGLNASYGPDGLVLHGHINIGLAVALEAGLVTPVIREAERKPLAELARARRALIERARTGRLQVGDLADGTFTISNLGMFDVEHFMPIINPPEAAILAVATAREVAAVVEGAISVRKRMNVALAVDHRVADGALAAQFLQELKGLLQAPLHLLL